MRTTLQQDQCTFAFIAANSDAPDLQHVAEQLPQLFSDLKDTLKEETRSTTPRRFLAYYLTPPAALLTMSQPLSRNCWSPRLNTLSIPMVSRRHLAQRLYLRATICITGNRCSMGMVSRPPHDVSLRLSIISGFDMHEVFSRGQNPQHWHISRRGLGQGEESSQGEVYMEVARKESTLTDVDNELAGIVRRFLE